MRVRDDWKCKCGKVLSDHDVCPLPSGKPCLGKDVIVRPNVDYDALRKGKVRPYAGKSK